MTQISKKDLEYLAELARLRLDGRSEDKLLGDLSKILEYFNDLKAVPTEGIKPIAGGVDLQNVLREDGEVLDNDRGNGIEAFPEKDGGFLKTPKIL
jgi:aspartyl-tRNA(Asn)/glutamyl-tRNA(Gln) amidotransferase subunit C